MSNQTSDPLEHADRGALRPADPGRLVDQPDLVDEESDDVREYTGEPVETDEGWVVPQTQNRGVDPDQATGDER